MPKIIEAVYENGVFKPLEKVDLKEGERAKVIVDSISNKTFGILKADWREVEKAMEELDEQWGCSLIPTF